MRRKTEGLRAEDSKRIGKREEIYEREREKEGIAWKTGEQMYVQGEIFVERMRKKDGRSERRKQKEEGKQNMKKTGRQRWGERVSPWLDEGEREFSDPLSVFSVHRQWPQRKVYSVLFTGIFLGNKTKRL